MPTIRPKRSAALSVAAIMLPVVGFMLWAEFDSWSTRVGVLLCLAIPAAYAVVASLQLTDDELIFRRLGFRRWACRRSQLQITQDLEGDGSGGAVLHVFEGDRRIGEISLVLFDRKDVQRLIDVAATPKFETKNARR